MTMHWIRKLIADDNLHAFYTSGMWLGKRSEIIERDNNECQKCKSKGMYHKAECVHHKKHIKDYPELALVDVNLISLCNACHNEEHPEKLASKEAEKKKIISQERW